MKKSIFLFFMVLTCNVYSQNIKEVNEQQIKKTIHQFFEALEKKDTVLMKQTTMITAQIWRKYNDEKPVRIDIRYSKDDLKKMYSLPDIKEIPLSFKIMQGNGIAVAWVPYKLWVNDKFSHCGVDIFNLFKIDATWKIISTAYTIEKEGCNNK